MKKKLLAALLAAILCLGLTACGSAREETGGAAGTYTVGICQLVEHEALDAATAGFQDALNDILGEGTVSFDLQNAQGDSNTCSVIVNSFVSNDVDLILANATPALQVAVAGTGEIPILCTSVTEYGVALDIEGFDGTVGDNISGTSDLSPLDQQAAMIPEWFPEAETVGLLFCSAEANSQYQVDVVKAELEKLGLTCTLYPFADSNDLSAVCTTAAEKSDVLYVPTDNTVAANTGVIDNVCRAAKVPVMGGDSGICAGCGVATIPVNYYDLGYLTGEMAAQILTGQADISEMPIAHLESARVYNPEICQALGLTVPEGYAPIA